MADNQGVAYMGSGKVEVQDIDFPTFELQDGPGVNPARASSITQGSESSGSRSR